VIRWLLAGVALWLVWANRAQAAEAAGVESNLYSAENWVFDMAGKRMQISLAGLNLIQRAEGLALKPYKDAAGFWTIGYGHKMEAGEWWDDITSQQAIELLARDVEGAEDAVNSLVTVPLTQGQFDALVSFTYNLGAGAFKRSTLLAKVNAGDVTAVAEFGRWVNAGGKPLAGLIARRADESRMFEGVA